MKKSIHHSEIIFKLNERLFMNALAGVTDDLAKERISGHNNPMNWLVTHTVWARYNTAAMLGKPAENPYKGMFENFKPFDESMKFDSLDKLKEEWKKASALLQQGLEAVTEEHLELDAPFKNPTGDATMGGTIAFLAQHESYDIGQMGLLKKFLTKEAMSYN
ncbi:MAG: DinB family protein [Chitinophagaceae bacterium]